MNKTEILERENILLRKLNELYLHEIELIRDIAGLRQLSDDDMIEHTEDFRSHINEFRHRIDDFRHMPEDFRQSDDNILDNTDNILERKLSTEESKLSMESSKLSTESSKLSTESGKLLTESGKLSTDQRKSSAESRKPSTKERKLSADEREALIYRMLLVIDKIVDRKAKRDTKMRLVNELFYLAEVGSASAEEIIKHFNFSQATWGRDSAALKKGGLLRYEGSRFRGVYVISDKGKQLAGM